MPMFTRRVVRTVAAALGSAALIAAPQAAFADEVRDRQYWLQEYGISQAWQFSQGEGVTIAIIDTGVDSTHVDLEGVVIGGTDVSGIGSPDGQLPVGLSSEHGTMVASLAAGRGHGDDAGVIGSAPAASVLSVSMSFEGTSIPADQQIAQAVVWAVDNGADVISLSLTRNTRDWPVSWDEAFGYAEDNDVVVVAAAGNRSAGTEAVGAPATMPGVLTVGGVDRGGFASATASSQGITIGVMAPSEDLVGAYPGGRYAEWAGTSGATPIVAGIVALVRSAYPSLDAANVINRILSTATPVTDSTPDPLYGYGLVDAYQALVADVDPVVTNPLGTLDEWIAVYRRGNDQEVVYPLGPIDPPDVPSPRELGEIPSSWQPEGLQSLPAVMIGGLVVSLALVAGAGIWSVRREARKPVD
jgi:subtilisin family serine protease